MIHVCLATSCKMRIQISASIQIRDRSRISLEREAIASYLLLSMISQYTQKTYRITYIELIRQDVLKAIGNKCQQLGRYREIN